MRRPSTFFLTSLLIAFLFSLAVLSPHLLQRLDRQYPFHGVEIMPSDAEFHYAARVREVYDGFWTAANVFYSAPKQQPSLQPALPEWTIALPSLVFGIDPIISFVLSKAVLPFLAVLAFIGFFVSVTRRRYESLLAVAAFFFANVLIGAPWNAFANILGTNAHGYSFLLFARPVNPQWTVLWFMCGLWLLSAWWRQRSLLFALLASLCAVVLLYSYFYAWTYLLAFVGLLFLWCLWLRDRQRAYHLAAFFAAFLLLGLPYFLHLRQAAADPSFAASAARIGLIASHAPLFGWWLIVFLTIGIASKRLWRESWPLPLLLAVAGVLALNQQIVTGAYIVPHHYHWYFIEPLASIFFLIVIFSLVQRLAFSVRVWRIFGILFLLCVVSFGFLEQARAYRDVRDLWGVNQRLAPALKYLRVSVTPRQVVYSSDPWLLDLTPVYTGLDVYAATNANNYLVPMARARDVYFFELWLTGLKPAQAKQRFFGDLRWSLSSRIYAIYYREALGDFSRIPDNVVEQHVRAYEEYYTLPLARKLTLYPLDLFVSTPLDQKTAEMDAFKALGKEIWRQGDFSILSFHAAR